MKKKDVIDGCIDYFGGDDMPANVWVDKYALKDGDEILERTPDDMHHRLAREFARIEAKFGGPNQMGEEEIYGLFKNFRYIIPGGSVMSGLGNKNYRGSLSNCFVIEGPRDSYASIDRSRERMTGIFKMRGGVGLDISNLRPSGAKVSNAAGESTGPVSFMSGYSHKVREVAQAGRRGALMISFSCLHPDIEEFIESKQNISEITGANISVRFTDDFMEAVRDDGDFVLRFPVDMPVPVGLGDDELPYNQKVFKNDRCFMRVRAKEVWDKFVHCAWNTAEPGLMFSDRQVNYSPDGVYPQYKGVTTNPCGEIFMQPFDSCRLIHVNFASFVEDGVFNYDKFGDVCRKAVRLADDLVELEFEAVARIIEHIEENLLPEEEDELAMWKKILETGRNSRRIGVGGTALADAYALMGCSMANDVDTAERIAKTKFIAELQEEVLLAKERGCFSGWDFDQEYVTRKDIDALGVVETLLPRNPFYGTLLNCIDEDTLTEYRKYGRRNVSWSTMAPTGTVSIMTQSSSGVEPLFMCYNYRKRKCTKPEDRIDFIDPANGDKFTVYNVVHAPFRKWVLENVGDYDHTRSFADQATEAKLQEWYEKSPWYGNLAADLTPAQHVKLQAVFQNYVTASISKTCNLPKEATEADVSEIYMSAWEKGCKGCTVFREGSRSAVIGKVEDGNTGDGARELLHPAPTRPEILPCVIKHFNNRKEKWVACIGLYKDSKGYHPYEIFTGLAEKLDIPPDVEEGTIVKVKVKDAETGKKRSRFDLEYYTDGAKRRVEGINRAFNREFYNWAICLSGFLRQGMGVEYVIKQLDKLIFDEELSINSWRNGVKIALKRYVKDGDVNGDRCPVCGGPLRRENGCIICMNPECKWTACGN